MLSFSYKSLFLSTLKLLNRALVQKQNLPKLLFHSHHGETSIFIEFRYYNCYNFQHLHFNSLSFKIWKHNLRYFMIIIFLNAWIFLWNVLNILNGSIYSNTQHKTLLYIMSNIFSAKEVPVILSATATALMVSLMANTLSLALTMQWEFRLCCYLNNVHFLSSVFSSL